MKQFATFVRKGNEYKLIAGPNSDKVKQSKDMRDLIEAGGGDFEEISLVDLKRGAVKRRRISIKKAPAKKAPAKKAAAG